MTSIYLGHCVHCQEDVVFKGNSDESKQFRCSKCGLAIEIPLASAATKNHYHIAS